MKLCQYSVGGGQPRLGAGLSGDRIGDLAAGLLGALRAGNVADYRFPRTMEELIADGEPALAAARAEAGKHTAALAEVQLTSSLKGEGIAALRTHLAELAQ